MNSTSDLFKRMALGAAGGFAGTLAIQALMAASKKWLPAALPPMREDPGQFMVETAEEALPADVRSEIPDAAESVAAQTLAAGYGLTFGALYGTLRPEGGNPLTDGLLLGDRLPRLAAGDGLDATRLAAEAHPGGRAGGGSPGLRPDYRGRLRLAATAGLSPDRVASLRSRPGASARLRASALKGVGLADTLTWCAGSGRRTPIISVTPQAPVAQ